MKQLIFILLTAACFTTPAQAQKEYTIAQIQGSKNISPVDRQDVRVTGVVIARTRTGFFIQTPDEMADADPATSEGVFVFTREQPDKDAAVGSLVTVTGTVEEFRPRTEPNTLTLTEISMRADRDSVKVVAKDQPLPKPVELTAAAFKSGSFDQLERYEGMRVTVAELTAVSPTGGRTDIKTSSSQSNGTFFAVLKGTKRPFREPGLDLFDYIFLPEKDRDKLRADIPKLPLFDGNAERLRIESTAQDGAAAIDVPTYAQIKGLTGVMHYAYRTNTIFVDTGSKHTVSGGFSPAALPPPTERQFSVAAMNLENFFDDKDDPEIKEDIVEPAAFEKKLAKISLAVRERMHLPDVIGIVEAENQAALQRLADRISADSGGKANYEAFVIDGNDGRGIDNGFLVKTSRVKVLEIAQAGKEDKFKNPNTKEDNFLNDRPPLILRVAVDDPKTGKPFEFTAVVNHLKSFLGYNDPRQQDSVRLKKRLQAEYLAKLVSGRLKNNPFERIILLGDFNAYPFNDGIVDQIGTIKGTPTGKEAVMHPSPDLLDPDLINLVDLIKDTERYSYVYDGNAQALDQMLITPSLKPRVKGFGYARMNADFPETHRNDPTRPDRFSDHDPAIAYFSLDEK